MTKTCLFCLWIICCCIVQDLSLIHILLAKDSQKRSFCCFDIKGPFGYHRPGRWNQPTKDFVRRDQHSNKTGVCQKWTPSGYHPPKRTGLCRDIQFRFSRTPVTYRRYLSCWMMLPGSAGSISLPATQDVYKRQPQPFPRIHKRRGWASDYWADWGGGCEAHLPGIPGGQ